MKRLLAAMFILMLLFGCTSAFGEDEMPPPEIQRMIEIAQEELESHGGKPLKDSNEYTLWYYGDKTQIEWCGAFTSWIAAQGGVEMLKWVQLESFMNGNPEEEVAEMSYPPIDHLPDVFFMKEAHVGRLRNSYILVDRLVDIPKPGYQIFYGRVGGAPTLHTGIVESVREISEGVFELTTLEGNVGARIKRFCTRYTLTPKRKHRNYSTVPSKERIVEDAQYKLQNEDWYITGFGKTW